MKNEILNTLPTTQTITLHLKGLSCEGCVQSLTKLLTAQPDIMEARVSLNPQQAIVAYNPQKLDRAGLIALIEDEGFEAF